MVSLVLEEVLNVELILLYLPWSLFLNYVLTVSDRAPYVCPIWLGQLPTQRLWQLNVTQILQLLIDRLV